MLLTEETHAVEYLPRPDSCRLESAFQIFIFLLELLDSFRVHSRSSGSGVDRLEARLRLESAAAERRELVAKVADELMELVKGFDVRTFAV